MKKEEKIKKNQVKTKKVSTTKTAKKVNEKEKNIPKVNQVKCIFCHKEFDEKLNFCPHCNRNQQSKLGSVIIASLGIVLLLAVLFNFILDKYVVNKVSEPEYKLSCELVPYEKLVRNAIDYKNTAVKIIGKVVNVTGKDSILGNSMNIVINANMFDSGEQSLVEVQYTDKAYKNGLLNGDLITIYGEYLKLNGNTPVIDAKYIVFGEN